MRHHRLNRLMRGIAVAVSAALVLNTPFATAETPPSYRVDRYGQVASAHWPGKVTSDAQLRQDAKTEGQFYASLPRARTDQWGGEQNTRGSLRLTSTGYFHVENAKGRSVLVDPSGNQFFSTGLNVVSVGDTYTQVAGREGLYEQLPPVTGSPLSAGWMNGENQNYSFYVANQVRKYGTWNRDDFWRRSTSRMKAMGFNTIGGFSDQRQNVVRYPYVAHVDEVPDYWVNDIYDIYRPGLQAELDAAMVKQISHLRNDPYLVGYMFFNEINWAKLRTNVSDSLASDTSTKTAFVTMLRTRYRGDVAAFNAAWQTSFASFDDLLGAQFSPATDAAVADTDAFAETYLDKFYAMFSGAIRRADPHHMVIGDRWFGRTMDDAKLRRQVSTAAGKHLDALTYNYYAWDPSMERLAEMYRYSGGKPFIVTEFHFGEPSRGLTFAINMAKDEDEKGRLYRHYVEKMAASGMVVGAHWFEYLDQAATGRWFQGFNGEAGAIGMVDVTDRPYRTLVRHVARTNAAIYDVMNGKQKPYPFTFADWQTERASDKVTSMPRASTPPTIDGTLDASWPAGPTLSLGAGDLTDGVAQTGVSGDFRLAWDATNLYLHAAITDPTAMLNDNHGFNIWDGDALELFVGAKNVEQGGGIQVTDNQVIISGQPLDASGKAEYYWYNGRTSQPAITGVVKPAPGGYTVEAAIPLKSLGIDPVNPPQQLRFDIGFDDGDGNSRQRQFLWNGVEANAANREKWGRAWLVTNASDPLPTDATPSKPAFSVASLVAAQGDYVELRAKGLRPGEALPVLLDGERLATLSADRTGTAKAYLRIPSLARPGPHVLSVRRGNTRLWSTLVWVRRAR